MYEEEKFVIPKVKEFIREQNSRAIAEDFDKIVNSFERLLFEEIRSKIKGTVTYDVNSIEITDMLNLMNLVQQDIRFPSELKSLIFPEVLVQVYDDLVDAGYTIYKFTFNRDIVRGEIGISWDSRSTKATDVSPVTTSTISRNLQGIKDFVRGNVHLYRKGE